MKNNDMSDSFKKVSVSSMLTYFRTLSTENQENILRWAKASKNPNSNVNTVKPSEWEKNMKQIFSQLSPQEQVEAISQATQLFEQKKSREAKLNNK